jgi:putative oxidoreductase
MSIANTHSVGTSASNPLASLVSPLAALGPLSLRVGFGVTFVYYGWQKLTGLAGFANMMLGGNVFLASLVTVAELAGGLGMLFGFGLLMMGRAGLGDLVTRLAGLAIIPVMLGAIFMVHLPKGFHFMPMDGTPIGGFSYQFMLLLVGVYFLAKGNTDLKG